MISYNKSLGMLGEINELNQIRLNYLIFRYIINLRCLMAISYNKGGFTKHAHPFFSFNNEFI